MDLRLLAGGVPERRASPPLEAPPRRRNQSLDGCARGLSLGGVRLSVDVAPALGLLLRTAIRAQDDGPAGGIPRRAERRSARRSAPVRAATAPRFQDQPPGGSSASVLLVSWRGGSGALSVRQPARDSSAASPAEVLGDSHLHRADVRPSTRARSIRLDRRSRSRLLAHNHAPSLRRDVFGFVMGPGSGSNLGTAPTPRRRHPRRPAASRFSYLACRGWCFCFRAFLFGLSFSMLMDLRGLLHPERAIREE
jgi:hypothetical protein